MVANMVDEVVAKMVEAVMAGDGVECRNPLLSAMTLPNVHPQNLLAIERTLAISCYLAGF